MNITRCSFFLITDDTDCTDNSQEILLFFPNAGRIAAVNYSMIYADLTYEVIGCAMRVHRYFGLGYPESVYRKSLLIELGNAGLNARSELERDIYYQGQLVGSRRLDILVEGKLLLELKATNVLNEAHVNQVLNYLKLFDIRLGLLLNFGTARLEYRRFVL